MRRGYGQFCPVAKAAEIFCGRWNALLLRELAAGSVRFSEIRRGVPLMSPSMLARRLRELEEEGVIESRGSGSTRTYALTPAGSEFLPLVEGLGVWGQRWTRRQLREDEIDHGLLLWDMQRTVRGDAFGERRTVLQLEFTDLPAGQRRWWFVHEAGPAELCVHDPGFEVDFYLTTTVADMIHIWRGDLRLVRAIDEGRLEAHGPSGMVRRLDAWLNLSPLAAVEPVRSAGAER